MDGKAVGTLGRKRLISEAGLSSMSDELTSATLCLNADTIQEFKVRCQQKIAEGKGWNSFVPSDSIHISNKTVNSYIKKGTFATRQGQIKNSGRSEAYLNIRNPISCAAVLTSVERQVDLENFHSFDDLSVLVNGWEEKVSNFMIYQ